MVLPRLVGHAATYNRPTEQPIGGRFLEQVAPGAFDRFLRGSDDVIAVAEHNAPLLLGRRSAGTLSLRADRYGLAVEIRPPDTSVGRDVVESIRCDLLHMSFAFRATKDRWDEKGGMPLRTLLDVDLFDVSVVAWPAYRRTDVAVRSADWRTDMMRLRLELLELG